MCGIAGIYNYQDEVQEIDRDELVRIRDHMATRGPDGKGAWYSENGQIGLGHRRLSIIDLSNRANQPMASTDGKIVVTFNGEIYNYRTLRNELEKSGCVFRTQSDTEVLLYLYAEKGSAMVHDLRGMFAFAIWDVDRRGLLLARDPSGIKPLYYADDGHTLRCASQVKALLAGGKVSKIPEPAGWVGFYLFGSVPEPYTTFQEIRAVPAGSTMWVDSKGPHRPTPYYSIAEAYCRAEATPLHLSDEEIQNHIREALLDSVRHHLVADVAIGAFLSAGIDSGALVGLMRYVGQEDIQTVTLSFQEFSNQHDDEAPLAAEVAQLYGTQHTIRVVTEREFHKDFPRILDVMDQPTINGINTWFVSKAAHELGLKVAVSGLGGDEMFGGYPSFSDIPRWVRWLAGPARFPGLGRGLRKAMMASSAMRFGSPKAAGLLELGGSYAGAYLLRRGVFMPWELEQIMSREIIRQGLNRLSPIRAIDAALQPCPKSAFAKVAVLESSLYMRNQLLRDTDWASMAHSIEVRVPLVDAKLLEAIAPITANSLKPASKNGLALSPKTPLPAAVVSRKKTGFATPIASWLQRSTLTGTYASVPALASSRCHWSRRWAHDVARVYIE